MAIDRFRGDNFYLSNMYPLAVWIPTDLGILVPTSEHAYMANRILDPDLHRQVAEARDIAGRTSAYALGMAAKELTRRLLAEGAEQVPGGDTVRIDIMGRVIWNKFTYNPELATLLVATGEAEIVEGNDHGDTFWGVAPSVNGTGENHLGQILMEVRFKLRAV